MNRDIQVSAPVSKETKDQLDSFVRSSGMKKGYVIEMALLHYLQALRDLPADLLVSPRLVLTGKSGQAVARKIAGRAKPRRALRELMAEDGD